MFWLILAQLACAGAPTLHSQTAELKRTEASPLPVRAIWPEGDGPFPVIVFSHGVYGNRDGYKPLVEHWARNGYLVVMPSHGDKGKVTDVAALIKRPQELKLVLDRVPTLVEKAGLGGKVDLEHIGVAGHSYGAHSAMMVGGMVMTNPKTGKAIRTADDRVDSLLVISPGGTEASVRPDAWDNLVSPSLMVIGSEDVSNRNGKDAAWRRQAWSHVKDGWLLWIKGADHDYGGIADKGDGDRTQVKILQDTTLQFWDATLKGHSEAEAWLDDNKIGEHYGGKASVERRRAGG